MQQESVEFVKTFEVVVKSEFYKCLFRIDIKRGHKILEIDVVTALLYQFIHETIYIEQYHLFKVTQELFCRLRKALHGLK